MLGPTIQPDPSREITITRAHHITIHSLDGSTYPVKNEE